MKYNLLQANTINFLRFPLIVGVILIHSYKSDLVMQGLNYGENQNFMYFNYFRILFSDVIARLAVPTFFFISGFLYFYNLKKWNLEVYIDKSKKRFKSLFIPYLFWNTLVLIVLAVAQSIPSVEQLFSGNNKFIRDYTFSDYINVYWTPILLPFWFIKDLMILMLLSPIIWLSIKYLKLLWVFIIGLFWYFELINIDGLGMAGLFFFSCGGYLSINKLNIVKTFNKLNIYSFIFYPVLVVFDLLTTDLNINKPIHYLGILVGIVFIFNMVSYGLLKEKIHVSLFLSNASFFLFAIHEPNLSFIKKILYKLIYPINDLSVFVVYLAPALIIIIIALSLYYILSKICPKFLGVITGGR